MIRSGAICLFPYRAEPVIQIPTDRDLCERSLRIIESVFPGTCTSENTLCALQVCDLRYSTAVQIDDFGPCKKILS